MGFSLTILEPRKESHIKSLHTISRRNAFAEPEAHQDRTNSRTSFSQFLRKLLTGQAWTTAGDRSRTAITCLLVSVEGVAFACFGLLLLQFFSFSTWAVMYLDRNPVSPHLPHIYMGSYGLLPVLMAHAQVDTHKPHKKPQP